jgi:hypothetical protein
LPPGPTPARFRIQSPHPQAPQVTQLVSTLLIN